MLALMPGKMRRQATCAVSRLVWIENLAMVVGRRINDQFTEVPDAEMVASAGQFGDEKAEKDDAEIFVARFPR